MKKILLLMTMTASFLFAINVQTASKDELMCIKGIGEKKASAILKYRKSTKIKVAKDLLELKGFGEVLVNNVKNDIKSVACGGKKTTKKKKTSETKVDKKKLNKKEKASTKKASKQETSSEKKSNKKDSPKKVEKTKENVKKTKKEDKD